nr:hypothetical protein [Tanacetum cinerariifolium]
MRCNYQAKSEVNQKERILELKQRNYEHYCCDIPYAVSIKEDTAYPCPELHSASTKERSIRLIIEQRVKVNQNAHILELKRTNYEDYCSDIPYDVSIKEDTAYPCPELHSASTNERSIRRILKKVIRCIQV